MQKIINIIILENEEDNIYLIFGNILNYRKTE